VDVINDVSLIRSLMEHSQLVVVHHQKTKLKKVNIFSSLNYFENIYHLIVICNQPKATGPCKANFRRFYYNSTTKNCESFIYGGCQGNENNFHTIAECAKTCKV
jgi:hypothetical protein